ncbi:MAG: hypothetical protein AAGA65_12155 [Actinomycetota bacterium]
MSTSSSDRSPAADGRDFRSTAARHRRSLIWFAVGLLVAVGSLEAAAAAIGPRGTGQAVIDHQRQHLDALGSITEGAENTGNEPTIDTVFLGDSSAGAAFDGSFFEELTGGSGYALWLPDASPSILAPLLTEFFAAEATTDSVIIGVAARMFNANTATGRSDRLTAARSSLAWRSRVNPGPLTSIEASLADRSAIFRYRAGLRQATDWLNGLRAADRLVLEPDGQVTFFYEENIDDIRAGYEAGERDALTDYVISESELAALFELVEELRSDGVAVSLALLPTHDPIYDEFFPDPEDDDRFRERLVTEAVVADVAVLDLTGLADEADLFADGNHLNRAGAAAATRLTAASLADDR